MGRSLQSHFAWQVFVDGLVRALRRRDLPPQSRAAAPSAIATMDTVFHRGAYTP